VAFHEDRKMANTPQRNDSNRELLAFRAPCALVDEVRSIARRDAETTATILRRLLRVGLDTERRNEQAGAR
jgi:hypothetical protein